MSINDPENKKKLNDFISEHMPLIHRQMNKMQSAGLPSNIDPTDLHMAGVHGLMDALHKYDHETASLNVKPGENPFEKYAIQRIRGKMLDHVSQSYKQHVPVALQRRAKRIAEAEKKQQSQASQPAPEKIKTDE